MKLKHTVDSPILLLITPEKPIEAFKLGQMFMSFTNMGIANRVKKDGTLVLNIDTTCNDFTEHGVKESEYIDEE